jgi:hypothetical protein
VASYRWPNSPDHNKLQIPAAILLPFANKATKKPLRQKWLSYMILKLKFGGPCWV